jgi:putative heme degradation protein
MARSGRPGRLAPICRTEEKDDAMDATPEIRTPAGAKAEVTESILAYFREDRSRMTMMAARKFDVPEQAVVEALLDDWPIVRLRPDAFRDLMEALPSLGTMRVFVRSRAAVIESVGTFGGFSETGPFFNVQTDTLDMHILHAEIGAIFAVEKMGHDSPFATHSFQFFDHAGNAAFKAFLWENFPEVPVPRIEAFRDLARRFSQP